MRYVLALLAGIIVGICCERARVETELAAANRATAELRARAFSAGAVLESRCEERIRALGEANQSCADALREVAAVQDGCRRFMHLDAPVPLPRARSAHR